MNPFVRLVPAFALGAVAVAAAIGFAQPAPPATRPPATPTPEPGRVRVTVTVLDPKSGRVPGANAIVWIPGSPAPGGPSPAPQKVASKDKRFSPRVTAVTAGSTVEFPNLDRIHHNVFSVSPAATFDLGLYKNGASRPMTFDNLGLVKIYCNIHPQMAAFVLVVDGKNHALAGADGVALLLGVPPGRRTVKVWDERGGEWATTVDVSPGATANVTAALDASGYRDLPHKNKYGKDYPPPDDDENRY